MSQHSKAGDYKVVCRGKHKRENAKRHIPAWCTNPDQPHAKAPLTPAHDTIHFKVVSEWGRRFLLASVERLSKELESGQPAKGSLLTSRPGQGTLIR